MASRPSVPRCHVRSTLGATSIQSLTISGRPVNEDDGERDPRRRDRADQVGLVARQPRFAARRRLTVSELGSPTRNEDEVVVGRGCDGRPARASGSAR